MNKISHLNDDNGIWRDDQSQLCIINLSYFQELFFIISSDVTEQDNEALLIPFTYEEFKEATFQIVGPRRVLEEV